MIQLRVILDCVETRLRPLALGLSRLYYSFVKLFSLASLRRFFNLLDLSTRLWNFEYGSRILLLLGLVVGLRRESNAVVAGDSGLWIVRKLI